MNTVTASKYNEDQQTYVDAGIERASKLGNRGPVRFEQDGTLAKDILDAYLACRFLCV